MRNWISFCKDDHIGVVTGDWYLVDRSEGRVSLYKYRENDLKNYCGEFPDSCERLQVFGRCQVQVADWMVRNRKVGVK